MAIVKTVGVKDLKNNLSAYLREVRNGTRVLVTDRNVVVAELREPSAGYGTDAIRDPLLRKMLEAGAISLPTRPREPMGRSPVKLPEGTAKRFLDESRDETPK